MTIYRVKTGGVYLMQFEQNGIRVHKSTRKYSEAEALLVQERARKRIRRNAEKDLPPRPVVVLEPPANEGPVRMTLGEACARCYEERWKHIKGPEFARNRAIHMASIIGETLPLQDIEERHIRYLVAVLSADRKAPGTHH